ncbi:elongation of very long chain fatty acids protein 4-like [Zerene cesonia]|uniref:elongation of very long chain fatty acids protein 4-like n=1 Tax=Zerene cesonia TaxID=33412 RepID=UPI0018E5A58F|nr:elongation of very long chain fatty acids protein 4-like [Zerene cesonia]
MVKSKRHSRTKEWPLLAKPYLGITMLTLYLLFVFKWGPQWMKNRKPFNLERTLIIYNAIQVIVCAYLFIASLRIWLFQYKWICEPVDHSNSEDALAMAKLVYYYFLLKIIDLMDTIFFVLRKKFNQVSFLHVYHHTGMVALTWGCATYYPGGHGTMVGVINTFVHIVMYSYYLLTVAYPSVKNSLWWKKYITQLQIIQFFHNVVHMGVIIFIPSCGFPRWTAAIFLPQNMFMLILFLDFYIKSYVRKPKAKKEEDTGVVVNKTENNEIQQLVRERYVEDAMSGVRS